MNARGLGAETCDEARPLLSTVISGAWESRGRVRLTTLVCLVLAYVPIIWCNLQARPDPRFLLASLPWVPFWFTWLTILAFQRLHSGCASSGWLPALKGGFGLFLAASLWAVTPMVAPGGCEEFFSSLMGLFLVVFLWSAQFYPIASTAEGLGLRAGLRRSARLMRGHHIQVAWTYVVFGILLQCLALGAGLAVAVIAFPVSRLQSPTLTIPILVGLMGLLLMSEAFSLWLALYVKIYQELARRTAGAAA